MNKHLILFFSIVIIFISHSFSQPQNKNINNFLKRPKLHQFLEEPETEGENDKKDSEEVPTEYNETENEEEEDYYEEESEDESKEEDEIPINNNSNDNSNINIKCLWVNKYNVYSLQKIQKKKGEYKKEINNGEVIFNFCENTVTDKNSTVIWSYNETYIKIAGSIDGTSKNKNKWDEINDETDDKGLFITLSKGEKCNDEKNHQTYLRIVCDENVKKDKFLENIEFSGFYEGSCTHKIEMRSLYGCALTDLYLLKKMFNKYWYIFAFLFIGFGAFLCFYGHKIFWLTVISVTGLICCFLISIFVLNLIPSLIKTEKSLWILLCVGLLVGIIIGITIKKKTKLFAALLGASMGYTVSLFIYQIIQNIIEWNPQVLYYITVVVFIVLGILFGYFLYNSILIIGTTILGGYVIMRGFTTIFGQYIDEGEFVDLIKNGELEQLKEIRNGWTFAYLGLWLILLIAGLVVQCKIYKKNIV